MSNSVIQLQGLDHVVIRAHDAERLIRFYCDVLGCTIDRQTGPEIGLTQLRAGVSQIDILEPSGRLSKEKGALPGEEAHNMDHFCLQVDPFDGDAIRAYLKSHGVEISEIGDRFGAKGYGPSLYLNDPEGNTLELTGPPAKDSASS